jgi:hypothetical protein
MSEHRLGEIVIERPRHGMRISLKKVTGYKKELKKITDEAIEDGLLSPYLIKPRRQTKGFSDHIAPLYRWLRSHVGQPWDYVHSELCLRLDITTLSGQHIMSHVWDFVEKDVVLIDRVVYHKHRSRYLSNYQLRCSLGFGRHQLYIHPETRILCQVESTPNQPKEKSDNLLLIDKYHQYHKIDDLWYLITFSDFPVTPVDYIAGDVLLKSKVNRWQALQNYYKAIYAASKRQCNKKEIKFIMQRLSKT